MHLLADRNTGDQKVPVPSNRRFAHTLLACLKNGKFSISSTIRETNATDYYPNCYIISVSITRKDNAGNNKNFSEYAVFKNNGDVRPARYFE